MFVHRRKARRPQREKTEPGRFPHVENTENTETLRLYLLRSADARNTSIHRKTKENVTSAEHRDEQHRLLYLRSITVWVLNFDVGYPLTGY